MPLSHSLRSRSRSRFTVPPSHFSSIAAIYPIDTNLSPSRRSPRSLPLRGPQGAKLRRLGLTSDSRAYEGHIALTISSARDERGNVICTLIHTTTAIIINMFGVND